VLAAQGSPPIQAAQDNGGLVVTCDTAEFMLRCRVVQALTDMWPGWRAHHVQSSHLQRG
jgi:hypothetical protein